MERSDIYKGLDEQRERVIDLNTGEVMRREAWDVIDFLLGQLVEIQDSIEVEL